MRRLPHQGARHSTVDHGDASDGVFLLLCGCLGRASMSSSTCGCFLQVERSLLGMISLLFSLSSLWTASRANGSPPANGGASTYLGLKDLHAQEMGAEPTPGWARPVVLGRPAQAHLAPVRSRVFVHFAPSICTILTMSSSRLRWRFSLNEV
jgi:hypothetical protein